MKIELFCKKTGKKEYIEISPLMLEMITENKHDKYSIGDLFVKIIKKITKKGKKRV